MTALLIAALLAAPAPAGRTFALDPAASRIAFHVTHKLHEVDGVAHDVEARAVLGDDGRVLAMVRLPVAKLDTGDANRDANLRAVMEAEKHPFVTVKAVASTVMPAAHGRAIPMDLTGELDVHGVKTPLAVPVQVELRDDGSARVRGGFPVSLDAHHVERPALLFVKIDDACRIDFDLVLREVKP